MLLAIENFAGMAPAIHPQKLADNMATVAENCRFESGALKPWLGIVDDAPMAQSAFLYRDPETLTWVSDSTYHDVVGALIPTDSYHRFFRTDSPYPKVQSGASAYRLGIFTPNTPTLSITDAGDTESLLDTRTQSYVVTVVDDWGVEGPPSAPSNSVEVGKGSTVRLTLTTSAVSGYNLGAGAKFRIYRTNTGNEGTIFQYVGEVSYGNTTFDDSVEPADLQEELQSSGWEAAPDDDTLLFPDGPLQSLVECPGGFLAGHTGNTVFFSEPYVPTAWPYYHAVQNRIVGMVMIQGGLLVLTTGRPVLFVGSHPSAMAPAPIEADYPCVSQRSIVDMGEYALYASHEGLCLARGNQVELISEEFIDKASWLTGYLPYTIRAFNYRGRYVAFYGTETAGTGFVFTRTGGQNALVDLSGMSVDGHFFDSEDDTHYVSYHNGSAWRRGEFGILGVPLDYTWRSKEFLHPDPVGYSTLRIEADSYPVTVELIADGVSRQTLEMPDNKPVRLARGFKAKIWQVELRGSASVTGVFLADNMKEIV